MAKKELGHVELIWKCPSCGGINPGPVQLCVKCGAPQPKDVQFEQAEQEKLITDETAKAKAEAGPDIHCPFCGSRNSSSAKVCQQCGGDLIEGVQREKGRVLGAQKTGTEGKVKCPRCGAENMSSAKECASCGAAMDLGKNPVQTATPAQSAGFNQKTLILVIAGLVLICGIFAAIAYMLGRTDAVDGTVQSVHWERSIPIEAIVPVEYSDWQDVIPQGAELGSCSEKLRSVEAEPVANSVEVCGTPYTVDTGTGYGDVVQDCEYQVYDQYCNYSVEEWRQVDSLVASGYDFNAAWPEGSVSQGQRLGDSGTETYTVIFVTDGETFTYPVSDYEQFQQFQIGSTWKLKVNKLGSLVSVEE
jgi:ribosomal protein L40E